MYVVRIIHKASNRSKELYHSYYIYQYKHIYSTEMGLRNDYGFAYEYIYHDREYIIRTMNSKHAHPITFGVFLFQVAHMIAACTKKLFKGCLYNCR